jgi:hypothetical protein
MRQHLCNAAIQVSIENKALHDAIYIRFTVSYASQYPTHFAAATALTGKNRHCMDINTV